MTPILGRLISAQSEDVARYGGVVARTLFHRPDGESVPQIVNAGPRLPWPATQSDFARHLPEQRADGVIGQRGSSVGNE